MTRETNGVQLVSYSPNSKGIEFEEFSFNGHKWRGPKNLLVLSGIMEDGDKIVDRYCKHRKLSSNVHLSIGRMGGSLYYAKIEGERNPFKVDRLWRPQIPLWETETHVTDRRDRQKSIRKAYIFSRYKEDAEIVAEQEATAWCYDTEIKKCGKVTSPIIATPKATRIIRKLIRESD